MNLPAPLCDALSAAIDAWIGLDPDAPSLIAPLAGRQVEISVTGLDLVFCIAPLENRIRVLPRCVGEPDARISGSAIALFRSGADPSAPLGQGDLTISGDVEVARKLELLIRAIDIEWEEWLARRVGDIPAHQLGNAARGIGGWGRRTANSLREDVSDYLREESGLLPTRLEIEEFMDEVDTLRSDADRLEARVERILARSKERGRDGGR